MRTAQRPVFTRSRNGIYTPTLGGGPDFRTAPGPRLARPSLFFFFCSQDLIDLRVEAFGEPTLGQGQFGFRQPGFGFGICQELFRRSRYCLVVAVERFEICLLFGATQLEHVGVPGAQLPRPQVRAEYLGRVGLGVRLFDIVLRMLLSVESPDSKESRQGGYDNCSQVSQVHVLYLSFFKLLSGSVGCCEAGHQVNATPKPAARNVPISGPREEQQSASLPSITTAGTLRIPK